MSKHFTEISCIQLYKQEKKNIYSIYVYIQTNSFPLQQKSPSQDNDLVIRCCHHCQGCFSGMTSITITNLVYLLFVKASWVVWSICVTDSHIWVETGSTGKGKVVVIMICIYVMCLCSGTKAALNLRASLQLLQHLHMIRNLSVLGSGISAEFLIIVLH